MRLIHRGILVMLLLLLAWSSSGEAALIRLRSEVRVAAALIQLGDIAEIGETDDITSATLKSMTIGPAPAAGRVTQISLDMIRRELSLRGIEQAAFRFTGASEVRVSRANTETPAAAPVTVDQKRIQQLQRELRQLVVNHVQQKLTDGGHVQVRLSESQIQQIAQAFPQVSEWQLAGGTPPWLEAQTFQLTALLPDGTQRRIELSCQVSRLPKALALKQSLPRGQVIRAADLVWVDVERIEDHLVDPKQVIGTETLRGLRAEVPIRRDDVRQLPLIRRGEVVSVTAQIGSIAVRRYCRSLEEGSLDQFITLVPVDGKEKITARVSGLREAEIVLQGDRARENRESANSNAESKLILASPRSAPVANQPGNTDFHSTPSSPAIRSASLQTAAATEYHPPTATNSDPPQAPRRAPEINQIPSAGHILPNQPAKLPD